MLFFFLRQDLVVLHEADVLRVGPEALPADVHVVFADDGLLVAADAAAPAALAELLRVAVDGALAPIFRQRTRNGCGERRPVGGNTGERRRFVRAVCVWSLAATASTHRRLPPRGGRRVRVGAVAQRCVASALAARAAALDDSSRPRVAALRRWFSGFEAHCLFARQRAEVGAAVQRARPWASNE